jgi:hypothetical protein
VSSVTANLNRDSFLFDRKALAAILLFQFLVLILFRDSVQYSLKDPGFLPWLIGANLWALGGLAACALPMERDSSYSRMQFWVLFMAPLTGVFVGAYCIEFLNKAQHNITSSQSFSNGYFVDVQGELHKIDRNTPYIPRYRTAQRATPVFFARHEIPAGTALTVKNVYAAGAILNEEEGRIMANEKNYFGEKGSPDSIILRKTKRKLRAHESIKNSDVEPPYSEEFVLHETK